MPEDNIAKTAYTSLREMIRNLEKKVSEMKEWENYLAHGGLLEQIMDRVEKGEKKVDDTHESLCEISQNHWKEISSLRDEIAKYAGYIRNAKQDIHEQKEKVDLHDRLLINYKDNIAELKEKLDAKEAGSARQTELQEPFDLRKFIEFALENAKVDLPNKDGEKMTDGTDASNIYHPYEGTAKEPTRLCEFPNCDEFGIKRHNGRYLCEQHYIKEPPSRLEKCPKCDHYRLSEHLVCKKEPSDVLMDSSGYELIEVKKADLQKLLYGNLDERLQLRKKYSTGADKKE